MGLYFGVDIDAQLKDWWENDYLPNTFRPKYGDDAEMAVVVLDSQVAFWNHPVTQPYIAHILTTGDGERYDGPAGLVQNVLRKLRFVLRTGRNSVESHDRVDLLEAGDYPWGGAGEYDDYVGGGSGLEEDQDWKVYCDVVDKLRELRTAAARRAEQACATKVTGWEYLEGNTVYLELTRGTNEPNS